MGKCGEKGRAAGTLWIESGLGKQEMCEHVLSGKLTGNVACGNSKLHRSIIRVWQSPHTPSLGYINGVVWEESAYGGHKMGKHVLWEKLLASRLVRTK